MTQILFRDDSYRAETEVVVLASGPRGIALDRTVFYPQGGGQSGDKGRSCWRTGRPFRS